MKLKNITDVFFDLDHTLWDFEKNSTIAFQTLFSNHQLLYALDDFLMVYPAINHAYWARYQNNEITHQQLRYGRLKDSFDAIDIEVNDAFIEQIASAYILELINQNQLIHGATTILNYLSATYNLHIITNGLHQVQKRKIEKANLASYFKTITDSESIGAKKPSVQIYTHALSQANCTAKNAIMIGDCLEADVKGALNAGMQAIWFNFNASNPEHNLNITTINQLEQLKQFL